MSEYMPDNWIVLKIDVEDHPVLYKILAGWSGGYLDGDYWRMNSGITRVVETENTWEFYGSSGSCYVCHKGQYRLRLNNSGIYTRLKKTYGDGVMMMDEDTDWNGVEW